MAELLVAAAGAIGSAASGIGSAIGGVATGTAGTAATIGSILQGGATVLGIVSTFAAGQADAQAAELAAQDAEREQSLETLQGIGRRTSIKAALRDAVGAQDVAYAASGTDLSFGTARQARTQAYREADLELAASSGTELTRQSRLMERAANYRSTAKRARRGAMLDGITAGIRGGAAILGRE